MRFRKKRGSRLRRRAATLALAAPATLALWCSGCGIGDLPPAPDDASTLPDAPIVDHPDANPPVDSGIDAYPLPDGSTPDSGPVDAAVEAAPPAVGIALFGGIRPLGPPLRGGSSRLVHPGLSIPTETLCNGSVCVKAGGISK